MGYMVDLADRIYEPNEELLLAIAERLERIAELMEKQQTAAEWAAQFHVGLAHQTTESWPQRIMACYIEGREDGEICSHVPCATTRLSIAQNP